MRVVFLLPKVQADRGAFHSTMRRAAALASRHEVSVWLVRDRRARGASQGAAHAPAGVTLRALTTVEEGAVVEVDGVPVPPERRLLAAAPSRLVPGPWEGTFSALSDEVLRDALRDASADVVVSSCPATLAAAVSWAPSQASLVHQERFRPVQRRHALDALRVYGARLDAVAVGDDATAALLRDELGAGCPPLVTVPDPLAPGFRPRAQGSGGLIVAAGALSPEQQHLQLVRAFGQVAPQLPGWRLRIFGQGRLRAELRAAVRKALLFDRVELPGISADMATEWARGDIAVVTAKGSTPLSVAEAMAAGLPLVASNHVEGAAHLVEHERDGLLVAPGSSAALGAALVRLADDPGLRQRLGAAAADRVAAWEHDAAGARFEELLEQARASRAATSVPAGAPAADPAPADAARPPEHAPAEHLHRALDRLVRTARAVTDDWLVLPAVGERPPVVVVPAARRGAYLAHLVGGDGAGLEVVRQDEESIEPGPPRGPLGRVGEVLQRAQPSVLALAPPRAWGGRPTLAGAGCQVDVEFWDEAGCVLTPPRPNEWVGEWRPGSGLVDLEVAGVAVRTVPLATRPTMQDRTFPVDAVYTWVDGDDPAWQARRAARLGGVQGLSLSRAASGRARYASREELRYSMRSLHLFAPWLRHIYVVTDGQVPGWLDTTHAGVTVVPHAEILPARHLPTFNSHAIETGLHRIPGLSDQFVYFNDDVLLGRPLGPHRFFDVAGKPAAFVGEQGIGDDTPDTLPFQRAGLNNRALLERDFGKVITRVMRHTPHPCDRRVLHRLEEAYPDEIERTSAAAFRSETDVSVASSLSQHFGLLTGEAHESRIESRYVALTAPSVESVLEGLLRTREAEAICVADHHDWAVPEARVNAVLREFFEAYYPVAAPWELPAGA